MPSLRTLEVREHCADTGRNPKIGEELEIAASRVKAFEPISALKAVANGA
ncbi:HU family DNA-binding protein [Nitrosospira sp. Is2]